MLYTQTPHVAALYSLCLSVCLCLPQIRPATASHGLTARRPHAYIRAQAQNAARRCQSPSLAQPRLLPKARPCKRKAKRKTEGTGSTAVYIQLQESIAPITWRAQAHCGVCRVVPRGHSRHRRAAHHAQAAGRSTLAALRRSHCRTPTAPSSPRLQPPNPVASEVAALATDEVRPLPLPLPPVSRSRPRGATGVVAAGVWSVCSAIGVPA